MKKAILEVVTALPLLTGLGDGSTFSGGGQTVEQYDGSLVTVDADISAHSGMAYNDAVFYQEGIEGFTKTTGTTIVGNTAYFPVAGRAITRVFDISGTIGDIFEVSIGLTSNGATRAYVSGVTSYGYALTYLHDVEQVVTKRITLIEDNTTLQLQIYNWTDASYQGTYVTVGKIRIRKLSSGDQKIGFPKDTDTFSGFDRAYKEHSLFDVVKSPYTDVTLIGDSWTTHQNYWYGFDISSAVAIATNKGISGNTLQQMAIRFTADAITPGYPIVLQGGVNDLQGATDSSIVQTMLDATTSCLDEADAAGLYIAVTNVGPWSNAATWTEDRQTWTEQYNAQLASLLASRGIKHIDIYTLLADGTAIAAEYDNGDGLHLNATGDLVLGKFVKDAVESTLVGLATESYLCHPVDSNGLSLTYDERVDSTPYAIGDKAYSGSFALTCTVDGTSDISAPAITSADLGATVVDGGVTWSVDSWYQVTRGYLGDSVTSTVASLPTVDVITTNNFGARIAVEPATTGQTGWALNSYTDTNNEIGVLIEPTTVTLRKRIGGVDYDAAVSYTHAADTQVEVDLYLTTSEMGCRVREIGGAWSAWTTTANGDDAVIADTYQIGSRNGLVHLNGHFRDVQIYKTSDPKSKLESI